MRSSRAPCWRAPGIPADEPRNVRLVDVERTRGPVMEEMEAADAAEREGYHFHQGDDVRLETQTLTAHRERLAEILRRIDHR